MTGPDQWGLARVNAFLFAVRSGRFKSGQFDRAYSPKDHPLYRAKRKRQKVMFSKKQVKQTFFNSRKRINIRREFASQNRLRINFEKLRKQLKGYFTKVFNDFATEYENMGLIETAFSRNQDMIFKILDNHYRVVIEAFGTRMQAIYKRRFSI